MSAVYAGIGGVLYAPLVGFMDQTAFGLWPSVFYVSVVVVGGMGRLPGVVLGAVVLTLLPEVLVGLQDYKGLIYSALLLGFLVLMPDGLYGAARRVLAR